MRLSAGRLAGRSQMTDNPLPARAHLYQHLRCHALTLSDEAQQNVLRAYVRCAKPECLKPCEFQDAPGAR
jgi:hypothetical protein